MADEKKGGLSGRRNYSLEKTPSRAVQKRELEKNARSWQPLKKSKVGSKQKGYWYTLDAEEYRRAFPHKPHSEWPPRLINDYGKPAFSQQSMHYNPEERYSGRKVEYPTAESLRKGLNPKLHALTESLIDVDQQMRPTPTTPTDLKPISIQQHLRLVDEAKLRSALPGVVRPGYNYYLHVAGPHSAALVEKSGLFSIDPPFLTGPWNVQQRTGMRVVSEIYEKGRETGIIEPETTYHSRYGRGGRAYIIELPEKMSLDELFPFVEGDEPWLKDAPEKWRHYVEDLPYDEKTESGGRSYYRDYQEKARKMGKRIEKAIARRARYGEAAGKEWAELMTERYGSPPWYGKSKYLNAIRVPPENIVGFVEDGKFNPLPEAAERTGKQVLKSPTLMSRLSRTAAAIPGAIAKDAKIFARNMPAAAAGALFYELLPPIGGTPFGTAFLSATTPKAGEGSDLADERAASRQAKAREEDYWSTHTPDVQQMSLPEQLRYEEFQEEEAPKKEATLYEQTFPLTSQATSEFEFPIHPTGQQRQKDRLSAVEEAVRMDQLRRKK